MLTDEDLSDLLRASFADATGALSPSSTLTTVVRRRHSAAQRRRAAVRVGVPAVAVASIGAALATQSRHATTHTATPSTGVSVASTPAPALRAVSYRLAFPQALSKVGCVERPSAPASDTWLLESGDCGSDVTAVIDIDTTLPGNATPLSINGLTALYGRTDGDTRTIWAPNDHGSYYSLEISAQTSDSAIAAFFTPEG